MNECSYVKRSGTACGRKCWRSMCFKHAAEPASTLCTLGCGRATRSWTGFCGSEPACKLAQAAALAQARRDRVRDAELAVGRAALRRPVVMVAVPPMVLDAEAAAALDELIAEAVDLKG